MADAFDKVAHMHRMKWSTWLGLFVGLTLLILMFTAANATAQVVITKAGDAAETAIDHAQAGEGAISGNSPFGPGVIS